MIENFTPAQGVTLYQALTHVSIRDMNIGAVRSAEDVRRFFPVDDEEVFTFILSCARRVYTERAGARVRDVVALAKSRVPSGSWAVWSGAIPFTA